MGTGVLGDSIKIQKDKTKLSVTTELPMSKRYGGVGVGITMTPCHSVCLQTFCTWSAKFNVSIHTAFCATGTLSI